MRLRVFYGYARLTKKIVRKKQLVICFENEYSPNNLNWINRKILPVHTRYQTQDEMKDANGKNRLFTVYGYFIDDNPFKGNIDLVLKRNMQADIKHVPMSELEEIRQKLESAFYRYYGEGKKYS